MAVKVCYDPDQAEKEFYSLLHKSGLFFKVDAAIGKISCYCGIFPIGRFEFPAEFWDRLFEEKYLHEDTKRSYYMFSIEEVIDKYIDYYAEMHYDHNDIKYPDSVLERCNKTIDGFFELNDAFEKCDALNEKIRLDIKSFKLRYIKSIADEFIYLARNFFNDTFTFYKVNCKFYKDDEFDNNYTMHFDVYEKGTNNILRTHLFTIEPFGVYNSPSVILRLCLSIAQGAEQKFLGI